MNRICIFLLLVGSIAWGNELSKAKEDFARQDKALNETYADLKKKLPPDVFTQVQKD